MTKSSAPAPDDTVAKRKSHDALPPPEESGTRIRLVLVGLVVVVIVGVALLYERAASRKNHVALASSPRPVSTVKARAATFRSTRTYVGSTVAWNSANVGPQYVSAYVGAVLVRPGAVVKPGQVLATLDCRNSSAASKEIAARARALEERQVAVEHEASRVSAMTRGGFASQDEAEQLSARSASEKAEVEGLRASLVVRGLEVDDCILRAPFAGEVSQRLVDPGTYVRPGQAVVTVIDRSTVRVSGDAPEDDFGVVAPGTPVSIEVAANGVHTDGTVSRRAPSADESTRTVHFEIDLPNPKVKRPDGVEDRPIPAATTARLTIQVGDPEPAIIVPLRAATIRGDKATLFVVEGGLAKRKTLVTLGESGGDLYLKPKIDKGAEVVIEGRALLDEGDAVSAKEIAQ